MAVGIDRVAVTTIYSKIPGDCMRFLVTVLVVVVALLAVAVGAGLWLLKDPNRFKPELEALIRDTAGMEVSFDGDLSWQLWPPVVLKGESIRFEDESTRYELAAFGVRANLLPLLQGGELEVSQLRLDDLLMTDKAFGAQTRIDSLRLDTFVLGQPSPLSVAMTLENEEGPASKVTVEGPLTYFQEEDRLMLAPMAFRYDDITGTCDVAASNLSREPALSYTAGKDDLLPLDTFRAIDWEADCTVPELAAGEEPLRNLSIRSANKNARNTNTITIPDAFGGSVETTVSIDTRNRTPAWLIDTNASDIQSQALMDLIAPSLKWAAPLLAGGQLSLRGNTMEALIDSANGELSFNSEAGQLDIGAIKETVLGLARLAGKGEEVERWNRQLDYTALKGSWNVDGTNQAMNFAIDNLALVAKGTLNALTGDMDLRGTVTVDKHPTLDLLKVSEDLYGLPIPLRCTGTLEAPSCGLDSGAAQAALADYATGRARGEAAERLDEVIEDKVPEEYRDAAKGLLKGLFGNQRDDE